MNILRNAKPVGVTSLLFLPQNGVVDFGTGGSSPQTDRASTIDTHSVNLGTSNTSKQRPNALPVVAKNGYAQKIIRQEDNNDNGSLPSTPEQNSDSEADAGNEALEKDTRQLMKRFLGEFTGLMNPRWNEKKELATMKRVVDDVLEKHRYAYNGMINKLSLDDRGDDVRFVSAVANSLFGDGTTNWGRVASLVAFGAVVCQYLKEKGRENCVELVGEEISTYLLTDQRDWLVKNNSWDGFVEFFRVADPESTVRNTLMAFAGFAGIGATLALLIRNEAHFHIEPNHKPLDALYGHSNQESR